MDSCSQLDARYGVGVKMSKRTRQIILVVTSLLTLSLVLLPLVSAFR
jgi:hypothetical protein